MSLSRADRDKVIAKRYPTTSSRVLAAELGVCHRTILNVATRLRLKKAKEFTEEWRKKIVESNNRTIERKKLSRNPESPTTHTGKIVRQGNVMRHYIR